ncbi:YbhN family protein [Arcanobacterium canis]|uniref:Lysylphosphatidylglycerol synthase transmembrane domain-containing protein n=1 Tax=Arcanobacterium canis TaxID=999183 RepID=A0ABY8G0J4_9ACTO|nr:lysylphosphatidylglycerol synthase transmembrane domain-containing protein [Arcanobacterium canis]WFM83525.1 lysylphosphatidylglycerol synthase transmembrane domain-containing protein [Arcanobacterium canis]
MSEPPPTSSTSLANEVLLIDTKNDWTRRPADLLAAFQVFLLTAFTAVLAIYAQSTTNAVTTDVRDVTSSILGQFLFIPINVTEGLISFIIPLILLVDLIWKRRWRTLSQLTFGAVLSIFLTNAIRWVGITLAPQSTLPTSHGPKDTNALLAFIPFVAVIAAMLIVAGSTRDSKIVRGSWWTMGVVTVLSVIQGEQSLSGAVFTVLTGIMSGFLARYIIGSRPLQANGTSLLRTVRQSGIDVAQLIRIDEGLIGQLCAWEVPVSGPLEVTNREALEQLKAIWAASHLADGQSAQLDDIDTVGPARASATRPDPLYSLMRNSYSIPHSDGVSRNYLAIDTQGEAFHIATIDYERTTMSHIENLLARLRFTTPVKWDPESYESGVEHAVVLSTRAHQLGATDCAIVGLNKRSDTMIMAFKADPDPLLSDIPQISDAQIDSLWASIHAMHRTGASHGQIHADVVKVRPDRLDLTSWYHGNLFAAEAWRHIDLAQATAMLAVTVGIERTVASLTRCMPLDQIVSLTPFLQPTVMPDETREALANNKVLEALRTALMKKVPEAREAPSLELKRFSIKTVLTVTVGVIALYVLFTSMRFDDVATAIRTASPWWMVASFVAGLVTYLGAALSLKAYTQENVPYHESVLVQVAASVVTLVAPAGVGPAALNLRFLQKKGVPTAGAVAAVAVVQVGQFVATLALLILLSLITGDLGNLSLPSATVQIAFILCLVIGSSLFFIPPIRRWAIAKIRPTIEQVLPRLLWLIAHPRRIVLGLAGALIMTAAFVACFGFALRSFGYSLPVITLAIAYLISNSVGSVVPSPGGVGPVEAALTGGLVLAGIPASIAFSTAVLYRLFTFWGRVPLGWIALRVATKRSLI